MMRHPVHLNHYRLYWEGHSQGGGTHGTTKLSARRNCVSGADGVRAHILEFAQRVLPGASDLRVQASLNQKERLHDLFFLKDLCLRRARAYAPVSKRERGWWTRRAPNGTRSPPGFGKSTACDGRLEHSPYSHGRGPCSFPPPGQRHSGGPEKGSEGFVGH